MGYEQFRGLIKGIPRLHISSFPSPSITATHPMESSKLLARSLNLVSPVARARNVCPPLTNNFKDGNPGDVGSVRRSSVNTCAGFPRGQISVLMEEKTEERTM